MEDTGIDILITKMGNEYMMTGNGLICKVIPKAEAEETIKKEGLDKEEPLLGVQAWVKKQEEDR